VVQPLYGSLGAKGLIQREIYFKKGIGILVTINGLFLCLM